MIKEKLILTKRILEDFPETRGDGSGKFLNKVAEVFYDGKINFEIFSPESWTRSRRKVLEQNPHLDTRTSFTKECECIVKSEVYSG